MTCREKMADKAGKGTCGLATGVLKAYFPTIPGPGGAQKSENSTHTWRLRILRLARNTLRFLQCRMYFPFSTERKKKKTEKPR